MRILHWLAAAILYAVAVPALVVGFLFELFRTAFEAGQYYAEGFMNFSKPTLDDRIIKSLDKQVNKQMKAS